MRKKKKQNTDEAIVDKKNINKKQEGKKNKKKKKIKTKIPKSVQDSIPYIQVYKNGIIETSPGEFSKSYLLEDVNFKIATQEEQSDIFYNFGDLLNSFDHTVKIQTTIYNRNIDINEFVKKVLLNAKGDALDEYREEYNEMLLNKMNEGHNNLTREKYLTISIEADGIDDANNMFVRLDADVNANVKRINGKETEPVSLTNRLALLYDILNPNNDFPLKKEANIDGHPTKFFDYESIKKSGLTSKDVIAPAGMSFKKDYIELENSYARVVFLDNLPSFMSSDILSDITETPCNMVTSVHYDVMKQDKALKMLRNQMTNINANIVDAQKKASRSGYSTELVSPNLMKAQEEADKLLQDMTSRNQKLYLVTIISMIFGNTLEELEKNTKMVRNAVAKHLCTIKTLQYQQEVGFASVLPFATNRLYIHRLLTTESASVFIPFSTEELTQDNGMYYGLNGVSKNLILFNRINSKNANGIILGTPGSGKSFSAKREMVNVLLNTDDEVFIIDPEREYTPLAQLMDGEIIHIKAGTKNHINPFDMDMDYADDDGDPITLKSDFIISLCETILRGNYSLTPTQISIIDRCVRLVYLDYIEYMAQKDGTHTYDSDKMPTLVDFYELLLAQPEPEAQSIAVALEMYAVGSLNTFAYRTNVNTKSRFTIYDIKDIGTGMKELGLQVCLNDIWNRIITNKKKGKRTWFYIDEFYLLTQTPTSAKFLQQIYKRARKWNGIPTGITQNVEDLLSSPEARGIINNCDFILMLNQSPLDRNELSGMLSISDTQLGYITNSDPGQGLMYTGKSIIPFIDKFPTDTKLYKVMTTKPSEVEDMKKNQ